jgi:hypothetical protein
VAKARKKTTTPSWRGEAPRDYLRAADIARRVARYDNLDERNALLEATASLMDARGGDRRRLEQRRLDGSLTLEERELLAKPPVPRRRGRPEQPSIKLKRELAERMLITALAAKAQWKPGYTIRNLIADVQTFFGLNSTYVWRLYRALVARRQS